MIKVLTLCPGCAESYRAGFQVRELPKGTAEKKDKCEKCHKRHPMLAQFLVQSRRR